ncbi:MAG: hypothetical protein PVI30_13600 [Myxococcales bacterium]|jgi:hypothetical protein
MERLDEATGDEARLVLDSLPTPIVTRVRETRDSGMTVEQTLPFLRLHTTGVVDGRERRARIESVSMVVADGVPRLVLDLAYEGAEGPIAASMPATAGCPGVARSRRAAGDVAVDAEATAPTTPRAEAAVGEGGREPTRSFVVHRAAADEPARASAAAQLTLEEQLLLAAKPSYQLAQRWKRVKPVLVQVAVRTRDGSARLARWAWPRIVVGARKARAGGLWLALQLRARLRRARR